MELLTSIDQIERVAMVTKAKFLVNEVKLVSIYSTEGAILRDYMAQGGAVQLQRTDKEMEVVNKYARLTRMKSACKTILEDVDIILMGINVSPEQGVANLRAFNDALILLKAGHLKQAKAAIEQLGSEVDGVVRAGLIGTSFETMPEKYDEILQTINQAYTEVNKI